MGADTLQTVKASLRLLSLSVQATPIPEPFKSAVVGIPDAILQIISIVETAEGNVDDAKALVIYIAATTSRTIRPSDLPLTPTTEIRINEFHKELRDITQAIAAIASRRPLLKRLVNYDRDASTLRGLKQRVVDVITGIQLETIIATGHEVDMICQKQDFAREDLQAIIQKQDLFYQEQQGLIRQQQKSIDLLRRWETKTLARPRSCRAWTGRGYRC
ncbi:hypothetical protein FRB93_006551 [Tulasnella sp. JGI-2019a]|nr:hypothetical protein FRB93_006551 [Tulasnella sp. JGI-2019a]